MTIDPIEDEPVIEQPAVARPASRRGGLLGYGAIALAGFGVLAAMTAQRQGLDGASVIPQANAAPGRFVTPQPLPADVAAGTGTGQNVGIAGPAVPAPQFTVDNQAPVMPVPMDTTVPAMTMPIAAGAGGTGAPAPTRLSAPAMIVDLSDGGKTAATLSRTNDPAPANPALTGAAKPAVPGTSDEATFLQGISGPAAAASASRIGRLDQVVAEGAVISATLETAINSDLPGFARAVIARDVPSFDGTRVLVPRGSRVVGQYRSGMALGASRVFVIWTRLIRPDGVSIQLVSPGGDDLGRGGLPGKVNRHFLQRFGGSLLTSVLNGAVQIGSAALGSSTPVYINSVSDATAAATSAIKTGDIPPTIRTPQGVAVKIFVARDLDFSSVDAVP